MKHLSIEHKKFAIYEREKIGSGAFSVRMLLVRIIENNAYFSSG